MVTGVAFGAKRRAAVFAIVVTGLVQATALHALPAQPLRRPRPPICSPDEHSSASCTIPASARSLRSRSIEANLVRWARNAITGCALNGRAIEWRLSMAAPLPAWGVGGVGLQIRE